MSAIAGILHLNGEPVSLEQGHGMMKAFEKFPANDVQIWHKDHIFLGCHAQWITPESIGEQLPFYDYARQLAITADAIIDNREELYQLLQIHNEDRKKITDSQLILLAYHKWGENCPKYLIGDFAFMIWDEKEQKLFGARDFSGARTLYYFKDEKHFVFSSTILPIISCCFVKKELNELWLAEYLAITGMVDVADTSLTVYNHILQLSPSHSISVRKSGVICKRYHTFDIDKRINLKGNEYVEAFQEVFQEAVSNRLRTHKEIGAQLSGGLDSGSIVAFARKSLKSENRMLHSFSYIPVKDFEGISTRHFVSNESPYIKKTVDFIGGIEANYLDFDGKDSYTEMTELLEILETPYKFIENSFWLKGMYEEASKRNVGILLNGGRGNLSISWGSALDYYSLLIKRVKWVRLLKEINKYSLNVGGNRLRSIPDIARIAYPHFSLNRWRGKEESYPTLIHSEFAQRTKVYEKLKIFGIDRSGWLSSTNAFEQRKRHFIDTFHWNASNTLACKLSLPFSLWKRDPSNDMRVIQFCLSIPEEQYVQDGVDRALIRNATKNYLPEEVRLNQTVRGIQGADWTHRIKPYLKEIMDEIKLMRSDSNFMGFINDEIIDGAVSKMSEGAPSSYAFDLDIKWTFRSLVVYKFFGTFERG